MNNLKSLVNDKPLWESFVQELENRLDDIHRSMEQTDQANSLSIRLLKKRNKKI